MTARTGQNGVHPPRPVPTDDLWAITTYFNPVHYRARRANYSLFRELLPVPLIAIEYTVDEFELGEGDADILVQLRGRDVLWQKERLYNIARRHLPEHCRYVLWIDCDVVLGGQGWPGQLRRALERHSFVQPFHRLALLGPGVRPPPVSDDQVVDWRTSLVAFLARDGQPADVYQRWGSSLRRKYFHGGAWAASRALCDDFEYYDRMIVGGGDKMFSAAVYGRHLDVATTSWLDEVTSAAYVEWASALNAQLTCPPGYLETMAYHLWHGALSNRGYDDRLEKLSAAGFRSFDDLGLDPDTHCWRWSSDKPALHQYVRGHFIRRREDG